jgi:DNA-binding response OmpR family regulator
MSGYPSEVIARHGMFDPGIGLIAKPFSSGDLSAKVRSALGPPRSRGRVLIADDDDGIRTLYGRILARAGYEVVEAADGNQALDSIRKGMFDVLITDLVMPNREGLETIRVIRKGHSKLKIIAVSGAIGGGYLKVASKLGADAALTKPVSPEDLLAAVEAAMS